MHDPRVGFTYTLTFSCAEYESPDIENYLRKVNHVPPSYNIGKLCTEDPISVSHKFSLKFHSFFQRVLKKGVVPIANVGGSVAMCSSPGVGLDFHDHLVKVPN